MKDAMKELFPPDVPPVMKWRFAHFLLGIITMLFMFWAIGAFAFFGFPGFARASDLATKVEIATSQITSINQEIRALKTDQLEQRIYDTERLKCSSVTAESRRYYSGQVSKMIRDYHSITTGIVFNLPTCAELGDK
jgi:hypothetical protein